MALASGKASLEACPYVSDAAKEALGAASAPPIRLVKVGSGPRVLELGDETVIFRHDKTFYHPTGVGILVGADLGPQGVAARVKDVVEKLTALERVGQSYSVDLIGVQGTGDAGAFRAAVEAAAAHAGELGLALLSESEAELAAALPAVAAKRPLVYAATACNYASVAKLALEHNCPLAVKGDGLEALAALVDKVTALGVKDIVLDSGRRGTGAVLADLTHLRRLAIKKKFRPFGFPTMAITQPAAPAAEIVQAGVYIAKYASLVFLRAHDPAQLLSLLSWRQNLYTDPQKPIQVEPRLYSVGNVTPASPVYLTTNFSLTYYTVEGEVAASKIPAYILPVNTDGTSVLTAWAAGKFTAETISEAMQRAALAAQVTHKQVILPGYVAVLSGKLKEASGWDVIVGPREAAGIPAFIKGRAAS